MSLAVVHSRALQGIAAPPVTVEVHLANGLPAFAVVGLADAEVREARDRVRAAIQTARFDFPNRRLTVNLAPADLPKESGRFDLPIALGVLAAGGQLPADRLADYEFAGELALTGELRPVRGALAIALAAGRAGRKLILPRESAAEAALLGEVEVYGAADLAEVCAHLSGGRTLLRSEASLETGEAAYPDLSEVKGQAAAKRALEVAAAGAHSLLLVGPPGSGKSMLASRLPGLLPPLDRQSALETAALQSLGSLGFDPARFGQRPFRQPHHTASAAALVGGGCHFQLKPQLST